MNTFGCLVICGFMTFGKHVGALRELSTCHDDFNLKPPDGVLKKNTFGWLGFMQYTHAVKYYDISPSPENKMITTKTQLFRKNKKHVFVDNFGADSSIRERIDICAPRLYPLTTGLQHHSKAPRVTLIHKQFVIATAKDLLSLPKNYKLGNVIFGEYEREEAECGLTRSQLKLRETCPQAYLETPHLGITPHPEYSRFGVENSLALVKLIRPIKSNYMIPICLPSISERTKKKKNKLVSLVDYLSNVPRDFTSERMGKKTLKLYTHNECRKHRLQAKLGSEGVTHVLCSSGCGVRPGAPILTQNAEGAFELIGVAAGGAPCSKRSMRRRLIKEPPLYIDVYPYTTWIMNVITAHELPQPYPHNFRRSDSGTSMGVRKDFLRKRKKQKSGWRSRNFVSGNFCYRSSRKQAKGAFFYSERFHVDAKPPTDLIVRMTISAGLDCTIVCARLLLPSTAIKPEIEGVGGYNISVEFSTEWAPNTFFYSLGLTGINTSQADLMTWLPERKKGFWTDL